MTSHSTEMICMITLAYMIGYASCSIRPNS